MAKYLGFKGILTQEGRQIRRREDIITGRLREADTEAVVELMRKDPIAVKIVEFHASNGNEAVGMFANMALMEYCRLKVETTPAATAALYQNN